MQVVFTNEELELMALISNLCKELKEENYWLNNYKVELEEHIKVTQTKEEKVKRKVVNIETVIGKQVDARNKLAALLNTKDTKETEPSEVESNEEVITDYTARVG